MKIVSEEIEFFWLGDADFWMLAEHLPAPGGRTFLCANSYECRFPSRSIGHDQACIDSSGLGTADLDFSAGQGASLGRWNVGNHV
jgi:hypothetical protein